MRPRRLHFPGRMEGDLSADASWQARSPRVIPVKTLSSISPSRDLAVPGAVPLPASPHSPDLCKRNDDLAAHADTCRDLGISYERMGRFDEAIDMLSQHLVIAHR